MFLLVALATQVSSGRSPEPPFPLYLELEQAPNSLSKIGEYRYVYRMFFRIYDAALYSPTNSSNQDILNADTSFSIQFRYLRSIDKSIILESSAKLLQKNLSEKELHQIQKRVLRLNAAYRSVDVGDRSSLTYIPGKGTTLHINDEEITTIEGQDFAALYFRIWLGEQPISQSLKGHLLGVD